MQKHTVTPLHTEHMPDIARTYNLRLAILFGSQVTGHTHAESDYDIGYVSKKPLSFGEQGMLISDLMRVVRVRDERMIDLVNLRTAPPLLLHLATSNAVVLYEDEPTAFATMQAFAYKQYVDTLPERKAVSDRVARYFMKTV